jgi:putative FmdB family regulatory protein
MPIYEYECLNQKHRFEVIQKFDDPPVTHCTVCGEPVQKLLSSPAIQFKGTGWYITDYARKGQSSSGESESKGENKSSSDASKGEKSSSDSATKSSDSK